ncbi:MAG: putative toxin-antitoxin system toxin component, PIN family [Rubrivivax sp.]|nr:putative toxin-antitoxin system toxin component, PIN family [Rubrivivax sp.]
MRAVIDTNVLISAALLEASVPARVVRHLLRHGRMLVSEATFAELEQRLWRPKFDRYVSVAVRKALLHDWAAVADWVVVDAAPERVSRDPDDDKFVQLAIAGSAGLLVSGDADLLVLGTVQGVAILSPAQALALLGGGGQVLPFAFAAIRIRSQPSTGPSLGKGIRGRAMT